MEQDASSRGPQDEPPEEVIACADEDEAREEAARQQAKDEFGAEWIYLRIDGSWVAKRYVPTEEPKTAGRGIRALAGEMLNPLNWWGF